AARHEQDDPADGADEPADQRGRDPHGREGPERRDRAPPSDRREPRLAEPLRDPRRARRERAHATRDLAPPAEDAPGAGDPLAREEQERGERGLGSGAPDALPEAAEPALSRGDRRRGAYRSPARPASAACSMSDALRV